MASAKGLLLGTLGRVVLREARVAEVRDLGLRMYAIDLRGDALRGATWTAGDKLQVLLPTRDVRTYTPIAWDAQRGGATLVAFDHGEGPGAAWTRMVMAGDALRFVGPQRSVQRGARPLVVFGDETSFATAVALARAEPAQPLAGVFEVVDAARASVLAALGVDSATVLERTADDAHLAHAAAAITRALERHPGAELLLTGRGHAIQSIRSRLRTSRARERGRVKPYWALGKTGLD
jgi:NADPH-dependent ferric siderophore reductase